MREKWRKGEIRVKTKAITGMLLTLFLTSTFMAYDLPALLCGASEVWPAFTDSVSSLDGGKIIKYEGITFFEIDINNDNNTDKAPGYPNPLPLPNPCGDVRFRHALWHLMNRSYVTSQIWNGTCIPQYTVIPHPGYKHPNIRPDGPLEHLTHPYNLTEANRILDEAGYTDKNNDTWRDNPDGSNITLIFYAREDDPNRTQLAQWFTSQLNAVHIKVDLRIENFSTCIEAVMVNKTYHLYTGAWRFGPEPADHLVVWMSDYYSHPGYCHNYNRVNCTEFDEAATRFNQTGSVNDAHKVQEIFNNESYSGALGVIPVCSQVVGAKRVRAFKRTTFVYSDPASYLDEYAFLASVPANVFRDEAGNLYMAPIIYGESTAGNYLLEDWKTYCDHWGGVSYIDFVGPYSSDYMSYMKGYLGTDNYTTIMVNDPYKYGKEIALREWINSSLAVIAPAKTYFPTPAVTYGDVQGEFFNVTEEYYVSYRFGSGGRPLGEYVAIEPPIESPHPYLNDMYQEYDVEHPGAANISVHFPLIDVEPGYDYLHIYDRYWNLIRSYSGHYEDVWTPIVPGDLVRIVLETDYAVTYCGFIADAYVWNLTPPREFVIHRGEWLNFTVPANITGITITEVDLLNWTYAVGEVRLACFLIDPDGNVVDYDFTPAWGGYTWMMWDVNERPRTSIRNYTVAIYCLGFEGGDYGLVIGGLIYGYSGKPGNLDVYTITVPENAKELDVWLSCNSTAKEMSLVSMWLIDPEGNILFPNYLESEYTEYPPSPLYVSDIGHLNTLHPTPGNWTLIVGAKPLWCNEPNQTVEYTVQYRIELYNGEKLDYVEAAANGAVIASLLNAPLLFTATDALPEETRETLQILGVKEVIFVDPAGIISGTVKSQITGMGITIAQDLLSLGDIIFYIHGLSEETDIVLTVPTDSFFAPAALSGAFHGAPVLAFKGSAKEMLTLADSTWASQYYHELYGGYPECLLKAPPIHWMHELSKEWSEWIGDLGADAVGMESVVTVAPLVDVKPVFERAIQGIAKAGRIPGENAEEDVAFVNRAMLYPAIIYANPGYNTTMPTCVTYDYGMPDIPSDIPPNLVQPPDYEPPLEYVYRVNGWDNVTNAMESRGFTLEPHVGKYSVFDKLNSGVAFWYHSDHGGLGFVWDYLPFGQGVVGLWYEDPPDPQPKRGYEYNLTTYAENATVPDQYNLWGDPIPDGAVYQIFGEPFSYAYGGEVDRWLGNIHSVSIVFMDCYVGGSMLPVTMMRHGAVSAIGDMRTGFLVDTDWFCVKYTQEVMAGRTLGQAFVTAVTKAGYVYPNPYFEMTLFSPAKVPDLPWTAYPYVYDCCNAYVLYGDPDIILVDPTTTEPEALDPTEIIIVGHDPEQIVHDVRTADVKPSKTVVGQGYSVSINVTIENQGRQTETLDVTVYYDSNVIETETVALTVGNFKTITFTWNTTGITKGNYIISATADPVSGEVDTADNTYTDGWIIVTIPGDFSGDFKVSPYDFALLALAYGSTPEAPKWNPNCDVDNNNKIGPFDFAILSIHYGEHDP